MSNEYARIVKKSDHKQQTSQSKNALTLCFKSINTNKPTKDSPIFFTLYASPANVPDFPPAQPPAVAWLPHQPRDNRASGENAPGLGALLAIPGSSCSHWARR